MVDPRAVLNRLRWEGGGAPAGLDDVVILIRHRGAPGDEAALRGEDVRILGRSFLELCDGGMIPYHRVLRIERRGTAVWSRRRV